MPTFKRAYLWNRTPNAAPDRVLRCLVKLTYWVGLEGEAEPARRLHDKYYIQDRNFESKDIGGTQCLLFIVAFLSE